MTETTDQDHDQRFKNLLHEFLSEFIALFFAQWHPRFDFPRVEWLDKEVFLDPPQGQTRDLDLVGKLPVHEMVRSQRPGEADSWIILIHIEVEADDRLTRLRPRMHDYYKGLRDRYQLPVWSLAVGLRVGLDGVGWDEYVESLWEEKVLHFRYPYVGLPALNAEDYLRSDRILGAALASLMRVPESRRAELKAEALQRIEAGGDNNYRKYLLAEFVDAYWSLDEAQRRLFEAMMNTEPYQGARVMMQTTFERGMEEGERKGLIEGQRKTVRMLLEKRFGPLSSTAVERLQACSDDKLDEITTVLLDAKSLNELGLED